MSPGQLSPYTSKDSYNSAISPNHPIFFMGLTWAVVVRTVDLDNGHYLFNSLKLFDLELITSYKSFAKVCVVGSSDLFLIKVQNSTY